MPFRFRALRGIAPVVFAAAAPAWVIVSLAIGATPDEEEMRWGVLTTVVHLRALMEGVPATWTSVLGLGIPLPMVPNFLMHPLMPLLAILSPVEWVRVLYAVHTVLGALGMWHLGRFLGLTSWTRALCVFTYVLATPTQNYVLTDLWPSHYVMWTSAPWLLVLAWRMLESNGRDVAWLAVLFGLSTGLVLAVTHPAHAPVYAVVVVAFAATEWRAWLARWRSLLGAAAIALAIAGPNLVHLFLERAVFAPQLGVIKATEHLGLSGLWDLFFRPLSASQVEWQADLASRGTRVPFFGGPFAVLSLIGCVLPGRRHKSLALGAGFAAVLLFTPTLPLTFVSRYHFRDPLLLCAIPLAGIAADRLLALRRTRLPVVGLLAVQVAVVAIAVYPFIDAFYRDTGRQAKRLRAANADTPLGQRLLPMLSGGGRLAYSPELALEIYADWFYQEERLLSTWSTNALAFHGVPTVNGWIKSTSTDVLWPDERLNYGRIAIPRQLIESDDGLDLLGIRYVLARQGDPIAPGLRRVATFIESHPTPLLLYENPDASPGAFLVEDTARIPATLPVYPECPNDRLLCRDLTPLVRLRVPEPIAIARRGGFIDVRVHAGQSPRLLVIVEMFRPEWTADAGPAAGRLSTVSVGPGLLGVRLPPGAATVHLEYRRTPMSIATGLSWFTLAGGAAALVLLRRTGARRPQQAAANRHPADLPSA